MTDLAYSQRIHLLADKWLEGSITAEEKKEFIDWYDRFDDAELVLAPEHAPVIRELETQMLAAIRNRIADDASRTAKRPQGSVFHIKRWKLAAAAVVAAMVIGGGVVLVAHNTVKQPAIAVHLASPPSPGDIPPGSNKALLTLANGSTIALDSAHEGSLARQGNTQLLKTGDGTLRYKTLAGKERTAVTYNLLSTPMGGQYKLDLPDGSKVWLNAASSIRYPTAFTGPAREVEVTGEAYFEIAKNPAMPFRVHAVNHLGDANPMKIDVLGTHFNVNAYADETSIRTTLLEGGIRVTKGKSTGLMKPGQQTTLERDGLFRWVPDADVDQAVAWKNGVFEFDDEELPAIMRQIGRWYNIDVVYQGPVPTDHFTGSVSRSTSLSGVLKILKLSDIQISVLNNKIIVRS